MKNRILSLVLMVIVFASMGKVALAADYVPDQVLVHLQPGVSIAAVNQTYTTTVLSASAFNNSYCLATVHGANIPALVNQMNADTRIASASPNETPTDQFIFTADADPTQTTQFIFTADADKEYVDQFIFAADADPTNGQIPVPQAQFIFTADRNPGLYSYITQPTSTLVNYGDASRRFSGSGVLVAVLDTGISTRNALLAQHVTTGWNFINGSSNTDDSPSGIDSNGNGAPDEDAGHGTMVAGLINRFAPGATLLPIKVLDSDGAGSLWATVEGIRYAIARGAKVINMSFGSGNDSAVLQEAIRDAWKAGIVVVTAAGNHNTFNRQYPAGDAMTIAVGSVDSSNVKATFSNYGGWVDVVAPGVSLTSTFWTGSYASWSGTSFSAPIVSAEAALILSAKPTWTPSRVRQRIKSKANSVDLLNLPYFGMLGKGVIDMDAALSGL